jgi:hypothetical protein
MKFAMHCLVSALIALAMLGCRQEKRITILFSGDERGWIIPAG